MNSSVLQKGLLYTGLFSLVYFLLLAYSSYALSASSGLLQFLGELLTIPLFLILLFSFFYSSVKFLKAKEKNYKSVFIINSITLAFIIAITFVQW